MIYNLLSKLKSLTSENLPLKIVHLLKFLNHLFFTSGSNPNYIRSDKSNAFTTEGHLKTSYRYSLQAQYNILLRN